MSELRKDPVSGEWVVLASERARRPHELVRRAKKRERSPKRSCPFENFKKSGNAPPILLVPDSPRWKVAVIPNKYPALRHEHTCAISETHGPYLVTGGVGHHELLITRDHDRHFGFLSPSEALTVFKALQSRYRALRRDGCVKYVSSFFNWGASAGASVYHPHYQILGLPMVPPDIVHSLEGSRAYWSQHRTCIHCAIVEYELKLNRRIIFKDKAAVAIAPFASRQPFEAKIFPLEHRESFDRSSSTSLAGVARLLRAILRRFHDRLGDPDLNFFLHTAPFDDGQEHPYYHWHVEVLPKIAVPAGFELSTGIDINSVDPDQAAAFLGR